MENRINRLIWEAKKYGKPVNPWAICTKSVGDKIGNTERSEWTKDQKERYEKCVKDVKKKSPIKENRINEYGGYDDPSMYAKHAGSYMGEVKNAYNDIASVLNSLNELKAEILDDTLRKEVESFLTQLRTPLNRLAKAYIETEKKHLGALRGGNPTPRTEDDE